MVNVNTYITSLWEHLWKNESWNAFYLEFSHIKNNISSKLCFCDDSMFKDQPKRDKQEIQFFSNEHINSYWFTPTLPTSTTLLKTYSLWEVLGMSLTAWSMARNPCSHSPLRTQNDKKLKCKLTISSHSNVWYHSPTERGSQGCSGRRTEGQEGKIWRERHYSTFVNDKANQNTRICP